MKTAPASAASATNASVPPRRRPRPSATRGSRGSTTWRRLPTPPRRRDRSGASAAERGVGVRRTAGAARRAASRTTRAARGTRRIREPARPRSRRQDTSGSAEPAGTDQSSLVRDHHELTSIALRPVGRPRFARWPQPGDVEGRHHRRTDAEEPRGEREHDRPREVLPGRMSPPRAHGVTMSTTTIAVASTSFTRRAVDPVAFFTPRTRRALSTFAATRTRLNTAKSARAQGRVSATRARRGRGRSRTRSW